MVIMITRFIFFKFIVISQRQDEVGESGLAFERREARLQEKSEERGGAGWITRV